MTGTTTRKRKSTAGSSSGRSRSAAGTRQRSGSASSSRRTSSRGTRTSSGSRRRTTSSGRKKARGQNPVVRRDVTLIALFAAMIFLFLCNFMSLGIVGSFFSGLMFGLFGVTAYVLPVLIAGWYLYYVLCEANDDRISSKILALVGLYLILCILTELLGTDMAAETGFAPAAIYRRSMENRIGGGIVGGSVAYAMYQLLKTFGSVLVLLVAGIGCIYILAQRSILELARDKAMDARLHRLERQEEEARYREEHPDDPEEDPGEDLPPSHYEESRRRYRELREEQERRRARQKLEEEKRAADRRVPSMWNTDLSADEAFAAESANASAPAGSEPCAEQVPSADAAPTIIDPEEMLRSYRLSQEKAAREAAGREDSCLLAEQERLAADDAARRGSRSLHEIYPEDFLGTADPLEADDAADDAGDEWNKGLQAADLSPVSDGLFAGAVNAPGGSGDPVAVGLPAEEPAMQSVSPVEAAGPALDHAEAEPPEEDLQDRIYEEVPNIQFVQADVPSAEENRQDDAMHSSCAFAEDPAEAVRENAAADPSEAAGENKGLDAAADLAAVPVHTEREEAVSDINRLLEEPSAPAAESEESLRALTPQTASSPSSQTPRAYAFPPISLLRKGSGSSADSDAELRSTAQLLQTTLHNFGVNVTITDISQGPSVTRYEMLPEMGVKVSKIVSLADDIKLALAATDIRMEAPIPGKSAIGIEVPNKEAASVALRDIVDTEEFRNQKSRLAFAVGKDIAGKPVYGDIAKMPHVLIAGATGSGKSVCINTIIMSLLFHARPEEVKLIMIDPKVVELSVYNGIPHLMIPVVTNPQKAAAALNWGVAEMEARYRAFADAKVRDIKGYNALVRQHREQNPTASEAVMHFMPQLVIIVDELADLMMVAKNDVETAICRLAQLARAAGIHLIIATQRPSVDVITGLIKANMPSRIAFRVSSGVDSRTILDMNGAEKLLGKGDMLFFPQGLPKPNRVQGCFVSDEEVTDVVNYLISNNPVSQEESRRHQEEIDALASGASAGAAGSADHPAVQESDVDELFGGAGMFIIEKNNASIGLLQRRYRIGFNRAARIMDQLCEKGVVGESVGTKSRAILMSQEQFLTFCNDNGYDVGEH